MVLVKVQIYHILIFIDPSWNLTFILQVDSFWLTSHGYCMLSTGTLFGTLNFVALYLYFLPWTLNWKRFCLWRWSQNSADRCVNDYFVLKNSFSISLKLWIKIIDLRAASSWYLVRWALKGSLCPTLWPCAHRFGI